MEVEIRKEQKACCTCEYWTGTVTNSGFSKLKFDPNKKANCSIRNTMNEPTYSNCSGYKRKYW